MNKRDIAALEKVFAAEIEGRMYQSKAKIFERLAEEGYLSRAEEKIAVPPLGTMTCFGWVLTHAGRLEYCLT